MIESEIPDQNCPICGYNFNRTLLGEAKPREGDLMVCFKCCGVCKFDSNLRAIEFREIETLPPEIRVEIRKIQIVKMMKDIVFGNPGRQ
jgi:C4-type Zn-finger protein